MAIRTTTVQSVKEWEAGDVDRFAPYIAASFQTVDVDTAFVTVERMDEILNEHFNAQKLFCGKWEAVTTPAFYRNETTGELLVYIIFRRVRLPPDKSGMVTIVKWSKE